VHSASLPPTLVRLHGAADRSEQDSAWADFLSAHSDTVVHTCRSVLRDHDAAMDAYTHVLDALREDNCRRLRVYKPDANAKFTSWLVVVTRRLALDYVRQRYGRSRTEDPTLEDEQRVRRRLEDLVADEVDPDQLSASAGAPDAELRRRQLVESLRRALEQLDTDDRLLLALRFEDERPVRDIARTLGLPSVFHVYRRLATALAALRSALSKRGVEDAEP